MAYRARFDGSALGSLRAARERGARGHLRSDAASSHLHPDVLTRAWADAKVNPPLRERRRRRGPAPRRARRHRGCICKRPRAASRRRRRHGDLRRRRAGFTGLEIAVGAYAAALPEPAAARASSSCSRRIPRDPGPRRERSARCARRRDDLCRARVDRRSRPFASKGKMHAVCGTLLPRKVLATIVGRCPRLSRRGLARHDAARSPPRSFSPTAAGSTARHSGLRVSRSAKRSSIRA